MKTKNRGPQPQEVRATPSLSRQRWCGHLSLLHGSCQRRADSVLVGRLEQDPAEYIHGISLLLVAVQVAAGLGQQRVARSITFPIDRGFVPH